MNEYTQNQKNIPEFLGNGKRFYTLLGVIILIQISSIGLFMEPWFDEVVFADISHSLATQHKFLLKTHPLSTNNNEVFLYGPVFFYMQAFVIKHIAFSAFSFRVTVYISGMLAAFIFGRIVFLFTNSKVFERVFLLLFFTNFLVCGSLNCGRMEMTALLFVAPGLFFLLRILTRKDRDHLLAHTILSSILFGFAMLTTPRSLFLYPLFAVPLFSIFPEGVRGKKIKLILVPFLHILFSLAVPYIIWYYPHFGDPREFYQLLAPAAKTQISVTGNRIDINSFLWLLIDTVLFTVAILKKIKLPAYLYGFLVSGVIFEATVIPWSYHHGMILPVLILTGLITAFFIYRRVPRFIDGLFIVVLSIQLLLITAKYTAIWIDLPSRNSAALKKTIRFNIPAKSKVAGSYNYYYACINNNCEFRSIENTIDFETGKPILVMKKVDYLVNTYKAEYIVAFDEGTAFLQPLLETDKFTKIAAIKIPESHETFWGEIRKALGLPGYTFYNGSIYKRTSE